eukprot:6185867-Pleurochrysis_carterae.AAC.3
MTLALETWILLSNLANVFHWNVTFITPRQNSRKYIVIAFDFAHPHKGKSAESRIEGVGPAAYDQPLSFKRVRAAGRSGPGHRVRRARARRRGLLSRTRTRTGKARGREVRERVLRMDPTAAMMLPKARERAILVAGKSSMDVGDFDIVRVRMLSGSRSFLREQHTFTPLSAQNRYTRKACV